MSKWQAFLSKMRQRSIWISICYVLLWSGAAFALIFAWDKRFTTCWWILLLVIVLSVVDLGIQNESYREEPHPTRICNILDIGILIVFWIAAITANWCEYIYVTLFTIVAYVMLALVWDIEVAIEDLTPQFNKRVQVMADITMLTYFLSLSWYCVYNAVSGPLVFVTSSILLYGVVICWHWPSPGEDTQDSPVVDKLRSQFREANKHLMAGLATNWKLFIGQWRIHPASEYHDGT